MQMNLKITDKPALDKVTEIKQWLKEEDELYNEGFYCQWEFIENSSHNERLIAITEDNKPIGFLTFLISGTVAEINVCEIKPDKRRRGVCKELIRQSSKYFIQKGVQVIQLYCSPVQSEIAWKRIGFVNFPVGVIKEPRIYLYKIIVKTLDASSEIESEEIIELWNQDDYKADGIPSKWKWKILRSESSRRLIHPIIHPAFDEWPVCYKKGSKVMEKKILKNFFSGKYIDGNFLIIQEM